jgi:protein SCO1/2
MTSTEGKSRPFYKNPWVIGWFVGAILLTVLGPVQRLFLRAPPPLASVGDWSLVDHNGKPFGTEQLKGKVWVADYFFTRCPSICPELTKKMKEVQTSLRRVDKDIHFVSFSVDPTHDTPEVLRAYADKMNIDTADWTLVTGDLEDVHALIKKRMFIHIGEKEAVAGGAKKDDQEALFDISHLAKFALFDQAGDLRATFSTDIEGLGSLGNAARLLIRQGPNP